MQFETDKCELAGVGRNPDAGRHFLFTKKILTIIINMTYRCHVNFAMIHMERENEDRKIDRDTVSIAAGR